MHFVADSSGAFKTRSIRRNIPSKQSCLELLQSITATPWDPTGSKSETDAFIFPLSKDRSQPLSDGAPKEDLVADQELEGYEPESPLPDDFADLPSQGSEVKLCLPMTFCPVLVLNLLSLWNASVRTSRKKLDLVPRSSDFRAYPQLQQPLGLTFHHTHGCFKSLGHTIFEFHSLTPNMDLRFLFR